jgi:hypothetical protein
MHTMLCLACMSGVYILQRPRQVPVRQHQDLSDVYKVHAALSLCQHQNLSDIYKVHAALSLCQVSAFCSVLDKDLSDRTKTSEVDITPLLMQSYSTLMGQELERRLKQVGGLMDGCECMCCIGGTLTKLFHTDGPRVGPSRRLMHASPCLCVGQYEARPCFLLEIFAFDV